MQNGIVVLMSCVSRQESEGVFKPHHHPYYQLNHILQNEFDYVVDGDAFVARPGDTVLIPHGSVHSLTARPGIGRYFEVKFDALSKTDNAMCDGIGPLHPDDQFTGKLLSAICEENENQTPLSEEIMVNYLYSILFKLSADFRRQKNAPSKYIEVSAYSEPIRKTIRFMENQHMRQLSLDDIVAHVNIRKTYLCRRFREETSCTIFGCLMVIRVRKAVELLAFTSLTLPEICQETGFVNLTHFNRVFTKHVMVPPGHYRKHLTPHGKFFPDTGFEPHLRPANGGPPRTQKIDLSVIANHGVWK